MRPGRLVWIVPVVLAAATIVAGRRLQAWRDRQEQKRLRETHTLCGRVDVRSDFHSRVLGGTRRVWVWVPLGYERDRARRYPVLYLQDGQNVFDGATSFIAGREWQVDETATRLLDEGRLEPLLIVAVDNAGARRVSEYTPTRDARSGEGGEADRYGRMLIEELKPWIDSAYRTRPEPQATGIGGSSLGGLVSLYVGLSHPEVFGRIAALSPSAWWDDGVIVRFVDSLPAKPDERLWVDIGTREGRHAVAEVRLLHAALLRKGWREGLDLHYEEAAGATHDEAAWAKRVPRVLTFLFPPE